MMIDPAIEELAKIVGSKYKLTMLVAKRAKMIQRENIRDDVEPEIKEITQAVNEVYEGKLTAEDSKK